MQIISKSGIKKMKNILTIKFNDNKIYMGDRNEKKIL